MNNNIRIGLLAVSAAAALSLFACKTTDDMSQDTTPQAAPAADSSMPSSSTMPTDSGMPTNATTTTPTTTP